MEHRWEVLETPEGTDPALLNPQREGPLFALDLPLAGTYVLRLVITNERGVQSQPSETSDLILVATPTSRLHLQMVWDDDENDQDLHLVYADGNPFVFEGRFDCFWAQCRPGCQNEGCTPALWFEHYAPFEVANPRLDKDDQRGLGPENINVDLPLPGNYDIYAHYFALVSNHNLPTRVTVRLWIDGMLREQFTRELQMFQLWSVARVVWNPDDSVTLIVPPEEDAVRFIDSLPFPEGVDFLSIGEEPSEEETTEP